MLSLVLVTPIFFAFAPLQQGFALESIQALEYFENIDKNHPEFQVAVEEILKITYAEKKWETFFSYAQYYRKNFAKETWSDVFLLEPLALMRHCQNDILTQLINSFKSHDKTNRLELDQMLALSRTQFSGKKALSQPLFRARSRLSGNSLWKTRPEQIGQHHPKKIKIKVRNLCNSN